MSFFSNSFQIILFWLPHGKNKNRKTESRVRIKCNCLMSWFSHQLVPHQSKLHSKPSRWEIFHLLAYHAMTTLVVQYGGSIWINLYALTGSKRTWLSRLNFVISVINLLLLRYVSSLGFVILMFHIWNFCLISWCFYLSVSFLFLFLVFAPFQSCYTYTT